MDPMKDDSPTRRTARARSLAIGAATTASAAAALAALARLDASLCGGCAIGTQATLAAAIVAAVAWAVLARRIQRSWHDPFSPSPRAQCAAALLLATAHAALFLEAPAGACLFCGVSLVSGLVCAFTLLRMRAPGARAPLIATALGGLVAGTLLGSTFPDSSAAAARSDREAPRPPAPVVSILSARCPVCLEFQRDAVPELRRRLGDRYAVLWYFDPTDADASAFVRAQSPQSSAAEIARDLGVAIDLLRRHDLRFVPVTLVAADGAEPTILEGPCDPAQIVAIARSASPPEKP